MSYFKNMLFGGDYNPEQWPEEIWLEDMRILNLASINSATINVFSWSQLQPSEEQYDFSTLDKIIEMLIAHNYQIVLGTSTAALPAWMSHRYPNVNRTDFEGRAHRFGHRHNACPNSPVFRKYSAQLAGKLAERYANLDNLACWHISNEYGGECYCENCAKAFRVWLKKKYTTLSALNKAWNMTFWSHTIYSWEEIVVPNALGDAIGTEKTAFAGISLDYRRFMSDAILQNFKDEKAAIRAYDLLTPVTTNLMGTYKGLDYFKFAKEMDIVSWDSYPSYNTPVSFSAMTHDLMRGLKSGQPFMLMEQTPSQQNWQPYNSLKRPGQMRNMSYQAVAHGADTVQFFQLRRSVGACEKFHGAVIDHVGTEHTRVFGEVAQLGTELAKLGDTLLDSRTPAKVAIIFDWPTYWGLEYASGPTVELRYVEQIHHYYQSFYERNIDIDMIGLHEDFSKYTLVIAPCLYMITNEQAAKITDFVMNGGHFVTTMMSGLVDETDNVHLGGYPGPLKDLLGIWVEEFDALPPEREYQVIFKDGTESGCRMLCDILHLRGATCLAKYGPGEFYQDSPVITVNRVGAGQAYYVGTMLTGTGMTYLVEQVLNQLDIPEINTPTGIEIKHREKNGQTFSFVLNHLDQNVACTLPFDGIDLLTGKNIERDIELAPYDVKIIVNK
ncbi:beta-galactosidase [Enterococcus canis]|uniref:Beta-galactosidase n=1 Tax=Enterococcus canis TaxID=214095 RepID=A0A1L8RKM8_9ENTE|nr:beta-galactosidase [Enterococcus canis]OJG20316.1 beta-galactosidase [Enterococcus canis]